MLTRTAPGPVPTAQRLDVMDALRGIALLGVFAMNIEWFNRPMQELGSGIPADAVGLDYAAAWFVHVFVAGKFWTMFSLLFGMGFVLMSERIAASGVSVERVYLRRMGALLVFGLLHIVLMWSGDILHSYAIAGTLLMVMRGMAPRWQLVTGLLLYIGVSAMYMVNALILYVLPDAVIADLVANFSGAAERASQIYAVGDFGAVLVQRVMDYARVGLMGQMLLVPMVLGVFLIGGGLMGGGWVQAPALHRRFWWRLLAVCVPVGLAFTAAAVLVGTQFDGGMLDPRAAFAQSLMILGALPMALSYLAWIVLAWSHDVGARVLRVFAPAGRMALTHYLAQSLVCSLLFFGYGSGLYGDMGRATQTGIVLGVFVLQVAISHVWLLHFRYGPMEWAWRWLTYGRRPRWRHVPALP